uniref:Uncharacterized protein n=1 Tax=Arundo donax TaxID=35708 RepID=A0A0A9HCE4_ARUDO
MQPISACYPIYLTHYIYASIIYICFYNRVH